MVSRFYALVAIMVVTSSSLSFGCMCGLPKGLSEQSSVRQIAEFRSRTAEVIFEGLVEKQQVLPGTIGPPGEALSMTGSGYHRLVTFHVVRAYRGVSNTSIPLQTGLGTGDCGFDFETNSTYLVYATRLRNGSLVTSICSGTVPIDSAGAALRQLRGEAPAPDDLLTAHEYALRHPSEAVGKLCGRVSKGNGEALAGADVRLTQIREEPMLPPHEAGASSAPDGSFCISHIRPGRYVLTAELVNYDTERRWMGYYPGVTDAAYASPLEIVSGTDLSSLDFSTREQQLFTIRFRVRSADGTALPIDNLGIAIESTARDALSYHESHGVDDDGSYSLGFIPPGHYIVSSYLQPDPRTGIVPAQWEMAKREVDISGAEDIVLTISKKK